MVIKVKICIKLYQTPGKYMIGHYNSDIHNRKAITMLYHYNEIIWRYMYVGNLKHPGIHGTVLLLIHYSMTKTIIICILHVLIQSEHRPPPFILISTMLKTKFNHEKPATYMIFRTRRHQRSLTPQIKTSGHIYRILHCSIYYWKFHC